MNGKLPPSKGTVVNLSTPPRLLVLRDRAIIANTKTVCVHLLLLKILLGGTIPLDKSLKWLSFRNFRNRIPCEVRTYRDRSMKKNTRCDANSTRGRQAHARGGRGAGAAEEEEG